MEQHQPARPLESWALLLPPPNPPRRIGQPVLAWIMILLLVTFLALMQTYKGEQRQEADSGAGTNLVEVQGRYWVGATELFKQGKPAKLDDLRELYQESPVLRLQFVALAGELAGPRAALTELDQAERWLRDNPTRVSAEHWHTHALLRRLYRDYVALEYDAPSLRVADKERIRAVLGWYGDLALVPAGANVDTSGIAAAAGGAASVAASRRGNPDPQARAQVLESAQRTAVAAIASAVVVIGLGLAGLIALTIFLILALSGKLRGGLGQPTLHSAVYAETFAVWMLLFGTLSAAALALVMIDTAGLDEQARLTRVLGSSTLAMFGSLLALGWPVLRGIPWKQVRLDIGLTVGRSPFAEPFIGVACWIMSLPLIVVGLIVTALIVGIMKGMSLPLGQGGAPGPTAHPFVEMIAHANGLNLFLIFLAATVAAPVVEEIAFRGLLYRHLRDGTNHFGRKLSFVLSAGIVSFIFAVIHPQGLLGVPLLMSLAIGFTAAREWRNSLVSAMVAHAVNNGLVMSVCVLLFRA